MVPETESALPLLHVVPDMLVVTSLKGSNISH